MFRHNFPSLPRFLFCQPVYRLQLRGLFVIADTDLCFAIAPEHVDMWRFVIGRPDDETEAVDVENGWHG